MLTAHLADTRTISQPQVGRGGFTKRRPFNALWGMRREGIPRPDINEDVCVEGRLIDNSAGRDCRRPLRVPRVAVQVLQETVSKPLRAPYKPRILGDLDWEKRPALGPMTAAREPKV